MKVISYFRYLIIWTSVLWKSLLASNGIAPIPININGQIRITIRPPASSSSSLPDSLAPINPPPQFQNDPECGTIFTENNQNRRGRSTNEYLFFNNFFRILSNNPDLHIEFRHSYGQIGNRFEYEARTSSTGFLNWTYIFNSNNDIGYSYVMSWTTKVAKDDLINSSSISDSDLKYLVCLAQAVLKQRANRRTIDDNHKFALEKWRVLVSALESGTKTIRPSECDENQIYQHDEL